MGKQINFYIHKELELEFFNYLKKNNYILFQEDHFLVSKGIEVNDVHYCRNFAKCNDDIYLHGENFQVYNS